MTSTQDFLATLLTQDSTPIAPASATPRLALRVPKFVLGVLLERAAHVVPTRDLMPVLKCVQLQGTAPDRLRVLATDMELSVVCSTDLVQIDTPGVAVLPARKLLEILRSAEEGIVQISVTGLVAAITVGRTTWTLRVPSGHDYPPLVTHSEEMISTQVDRRDFLGALMGVRYAAARDINRASLMQIDVRRGRMSACDGARFAQTRVELDMDLAIPIGAVDDLVKLLRGADLPTIGVGQSPNQLIFTIGTDVFLAQKLHATFPDVEALWLRPALENTHHLDVQRDQLLAAIKRVRINADRDTSAVALSMSHDQLSVTAHDTAHNEATDTIPAGWDEPPRTIAVNHAYLSDLIATTSQPSLTLWLGTDTASRRSPLMLREDTIGFIGVVHQMIADWVR